MPAPAVNASGNGKNTAVNAFVTCSLVGTPVNGSCWIVGVVSKDPTLTVTGFNDDSTGGPMTFSQVGTYVTPTGLRVSLWATAFNGGKAGLSFLNVLLSGSVQDVVAVATEWTGATALGINANANNTNADPSVALTTQDANNVVVSVLGSIGVTLPTAKTGTLQKTKASDGGTPIAAGMVSNTAASPSTVTTAETLAAATWGAIAVELRTGAAPPSSSLLSMMGCG